MEVLEVQILETESLVLDQEKCTRLLAQIVEANVKSLSSLRKESQCTANHAMLNASLGDSEQEEITMKGTVKFFNNSKGFGFITAEDGKDYFVHQTGIAAGVSLQDNDSVTFEVEQGDRGPKAVKVRKE